MRELRRFCPILLPHHLRVSLLSLLVGSRSVLPTRSRSDQAQIRSRLQGNPIIASNEVLTWGSLI